MDRSWAIHGLPRRKSDCEGVKSLLPVKRLNREL